MNNFIALFNQYGFYALSALFIINIALAIWIFWIRKNLKTIFKGKNTDLEEVLLELRKNEVAFGSALKELAGRVDGVEKKLPKDLRRVGLVRYNPFSDAGGDQSFALAILNEKNDGIVMSSLYGREMNRVYAKLIENGSSKYSLTEEEKTAIQNAK